MRLRMSGIAVVLGVALAVAGCAGAPELTDDRAHTLQQSVLGVTQAAAEGRWDDASVLLTAARTELDEGADLGEVSPARYRAINAALVEVQTDLDAEKARADAAQAAAEQQRAAAEQAAQEATATPTTAPATPKGKDKTPGKKGKSGK